MRGPRLIDLSIPLAATTPPWPGDQPFSCGWSCRREAGESVNLAAVTTSLHVGTHADAPLHVESDWAGSEAIDPEAFLGAVRLAALPAAHAVDLPIGPDVLATLFGEAPPPRLLLRTGLSVATGAFPDDWPALSEAGARWLRDRQVLLWGVDAPSVDRRHSKALPVHHALLGTGAFVLENLDLRPVEPSDWELVALPLRVIGGDAAPVRAMVRR